MTYIEKESKMFELWDYLTMLGIATDDEIGVAIHFGGRSLETLENLLFYKTGYRTLEQLQGEDEE